MYKKLVYLFLVSLSLPVFTQASQVNEFCPEQQAPWTEACYGITAFAQFPPNWENDGSPVPRIAQMIVNVPESAGERMFARAKIVYDYSHDIPTPECPSGTIFLTGILGTNNLDTELVSGIAIVKIECKS